jgi:hypothetical protein
MVDGAIDLVVLDIPSVAPNTRRLWVNLRCRVGQHVGRTGVRIMVPNKMTRHDVVQLRGGWITCQCLVKVLHIAARCADVTISQFTAKLLVLVRQATTTTTTTTKQGVWWRRSYACYRFNSRYAAHANGLTTETSPNAAGSNITPTATVTVPNYHSQTKIRYTSFVAKSGWIESCCSKDDEILFSLCCRTYIILLLRTRVLFTVSVLFLTPSAISSFFFFVLPAIWDKNSCTIKKKITDSHHAAASSAVTITGMSGTSVRSRWLFEQVEGRQWYKWC